MKWDNHADDPVISIVRDFFEVVVCHLRDYAVRHQAKVSFLARKRGPAFYKEPAQVMSPMLKRHG